MHNCTIRLTSKFQKREEMGRVLSFTSAVAKSPAQAVAAASGAKFSADDIILVMKGGIVFILIIAIAFSIWRSFSYASPNGENLVSSSPAGTVDSAGMKTIHQLQASFFPLLMVFDFMVPSKTQLLLRLAVFELTCFLYWYAVGFAGLAIE
jgi:hypothetical protein